MPMSLMSPQNPTQTISTKNQNKVGLQMANVQQQRNSPRSNHTTVVIESSSDSDDSTPLAQLIGAKKRLTLEANEPPAPKATKKPKGQKKKKDPNEPQKPVSAYALFFRDTQAAIKGQSPNASFGEVSKIVASMWESLDIDRKNSYKTRTEIAKKEYLKALAAYRANLASKAEIDQSNSMHGKSSPPISTSPLGSPKGHISMPKQPSPVLTSVVQSMQPVTNNKNVHPQQNQQMERMKSPPQMNNSSPSHVTHGGNSTNNIDVQNNQQDVPQIDMNSSPPNCNSALSSPSNNESTASMPPEDPPNMKNTDMADPIPICLRNGCTNVAIDSPDWDREYCSSECVVSHCKDAFANWVAQRQLNSHLTTLN